jgi:hypothetical protein
MKTKNERPIEYIQWKGTQGSKFLLLPSHSDGHAQEDTKRAKNWIMNNHSRVDSIMVEWQFSEVVGVHENNLYVRTQNEKGSLTDRKIKTWVEITCGGIRIVVDGTNQKSEAEITIHGQNRKFKIYPLELFELLENHQNQI